MKIFLHTICFLVKDDDTDRTIPNGFVLISSI